MCAQKCFIIRGKVAEAECPYGAMSLPPNLEFQDQKFQVRHQCRLLILPVSLPYSNSLRSLPRRPSTYLGAAMAPLCLHCGVLPYALREAQGAPKASSLRKPLAVAAREFAHAHPTHSCSPHTQPHIPHAAAHAPFIWEK